MRVTIKDVALRSGVSVGTVSNVLNGKPGECSAQTRLRVLEAVRTLGYHPNRVARNLVRRRSHTLGISFIDQGQSLGENPYLTNVVDGMVVAAREEDYNITLYTRLLPGDEMQQISLFLDQSIDALCLVAPDQPCRLLSLLAETDLPCLVVGVEDPLPGIHWIDVDNALGAQLAMDHLLAHGHTRIAHLAGSETQKAARTRACVYQKALAARGIAPNSDWLIPCHFDETQAYQATRQLLQSPNPPSAIFAADDQMALGALAAAHDGGVRVPEQLSLIGFDDVREARLAHPPLTTIRQPVLEIGYTAAKRLIGLLCAEEDEPAPIQERVPPILIARGSVGLCPR